MHNVSPQLHQRLLHLIRLPQRNPRGALAGKELIRLRWVQQQHASRPQALPTFMRLVFAFLALYSFSSGWVVYAQDTELAPGGMFAPRGTPVSWYNLPVTENGYELRWDKLAGTLQALHLTIRPETATVFGLHLGQPEDPSLLTLSYDLITEELQLTSSALGFNYTYGYPLPNNALDISLTWKHEQVVLFIDHQGFLFTTASPLPAALHPVFFADAGMVQVTECSAWFTD